LKQTQVILKIFLFPKFLVGDGADPSERMSWLALQLRSWIKVLQRDLVMLKVSNKCIGTL